MTEQPHGGREQGDRREQGGGRRDQGGGRREQGGGRRDQGNDFGGSGASRGSPGDSWERRAADLASGVQRWLIKTSAKNMRDELGGQVRKALRGQQREPGDVWATATTEPPGMPGEAPECAWCPVCRAARRIAESRAEPGAGGSVITDAADVVAGAVRDALAGIDSILSYRPGERSPSQASTAESTADRAAQPTADRAAQASPAEASPARSANGTREPPDEPEHRS